MRAHRGLRHATVRGRAALSASAPVPPALPATDRGCRDRADAERRPRRARRSRPSLRGHRDVREPRRAPGRGRLHLSASQRCRVPGSQALDQRRARGRRDDERREGTRHLRGDRQAPARPRARRMDGIWHAPHAHLPHQSRRGEDGRRTLSDGGRARGERAARGLHPWHPARTATGSRRTNDLHAPVPPRPRVRRALLPDAHARRRHGRQPPPRGRPWRRARSHGAAPAPSSGRSGDHRPRTRRRTR